MRAHQQPTVPPPQQPPQPPQPPQAGAPTAPAPNAPVVAGGPMTEQQKAELRAQIQKSVHDGISARDAGRLAREAGQIAREAAAAARAGQGTSVSIPPDLGDWSPAMIRGFVTDSLTAVCITIVVLALGSKLLRIFANRLGSAPAPVALPPQIADQLKRIENTVDSMAIEIERISESQRFLTKLQAAKAEGAALPRASSGA